MHPDIRLDVDRVVVGEVDVDGGETPFDLDGPVHVEGQAGPLPPLGERARDRYRQRRHLNDPAAEPHVGPQPRVDRQPVLADPTRVLVGGGAGFKPLARRAHRAEEIAAPERRVAPTRLGEECTTQALAPPVHRDPRLDEADRRPVRGRPLRRQPLGLLHRGVPAPGRQVRQAVAEGHRVQPRDRRLALHDDEVQLREGLDRRLVGPVGGRVLEHEGRPVPRDRPEGVDEVRPLGERVRLHRPIQGHEGDARPVGFARPFETVAAQPPQGPGSDPFQTVAARPPQGPKGPRLAP